MVRVEFTSEPDREELEEFIGRVQKGGMVSRGSAGKLTFELSEKEEKLRIDYDELKRLLIEHQIFDQARGFSSNEMELLRIIELGPDRMAFKEIKEEVEKKGIELADSTIQENLRKLREKGLVEHSTNQYTYIGP